MERKAPKFKVGQTVRISIPRNQIDYRYNGLIGVIESINELADMPQYTIKFDDGTVPSLFFLEEDLEEIKNG